MHRKHKTSSTTILQDQSKLDLDHVTDGWSSTPLAHLCMILPPELDPPISTTPYHTHLHDAHPSHPAPPCARSDPNLRLGAGNMRPFLCQLRE